MLSHFRATLWSSLGAVRSITFITPHQDMASGGPFVIQQLAFELARRIRVNLVVQDHDPVPVPGVRTYRSAELRPAELPDAAAIIIHADAAHGDRFAALPDAKGKRFVFLQGFGTPGDPTVIANLRKGFATIACAHWLVGEARRYGSPAAFAPLGLDPAIFHARGGARQPTRVAMMAHPVPWKGQEDGLEALRIVTAARSDVEVVLFGVQDPRFPGASFVPRPSREQVAALLRESAVFVCPSWEEGFGMPGLEALACGAALATTDTKGSRDYAFHDETALVSAPRDPSALARNVLALLADASLRARLTRAGHRRAAGYPDWSEAALLYLRAMASLRLARRGRPTPR
jgi:glycosyltransferase involved in cell wall biosynthesis